MNLNMGMFAERKYHFKALTVICPQNGDSSVHHSRGNKSNVSDVKSAESPKTSQIEK